MKKLKAFILIMLCLMTISVFIINFEESLQIAKKLITQFIFYIYFSLLILDAISRQLKKKEEY